MKTFLSWGFLIIIIYPYFVVWLAHDADIHRELTSQVWYLVLFAQNRDDRDGMCCKHAMVRKAKKGDGQKRVRKQKIKYSAVCMNHEELSVEIPD